MKQKFLRIKVPDVQFDVPMPPNTIMAAVAEQLQTKGFLLFDNLLVPWDSIKQGGYVCLYEMEVEEGEVADFTKVPQGFKQ